MMNGSSKTLPSTCLNIVTSEETESGMMIAVVLSEEYNKLGGNGAFARQLCNTKMNDEQLLLQRLNEYGMREVKVCGGANCQFSALSEQLYGSAKYHKDVRRRIVKHMRHKQSMYHAYVPIKYKDYCKRMKRCGEWGDHVTLQAAADKYEAKICVLTSSKDHHLTEVVPRQPTSKTPILVKLFWGSLQLLAPNLRCTKSSDS